MKAPKKLTKDCFKDFAYRDSSFDSLLPKVQPAQEGEITVLQLPHDMTFKEMATHFFGSDDITVIKKHVLTLPMVEKMIAERENELETMGWGNFAFMENKDGSVSVAYVPRYGIGRSWYAYVLVLAYGLRWDAGVRLIVSNLESKKDPYEFNELFISKFWENVDKTEDCWEWNKSRDEQGYGLVKNNGKHLRAHRVSVLMSGREIPEGYEVDHLCANSSCVNPLHLEAVTPQVNSQRRKSNKLNPKIVLKIRELNQEGKLQTEIAEELGVSKFCINRVLRGKTWDNVCNLDTRASSDTLSLEHRVQKLEEVLKHHNLGL